MKLHEQTTGYRALSTELHLFLITGGHAEALKSSWIFY